jgi:hypothetical protein
LSDGDAFGRSCAALGDYDWDGIADLAVGAPLDDDGGTDRGAVWLLSLDGNGGVTQTLVISSTSGGFGGDLDDQDYFGHATGALGDFTGDGSPELLVGSSYDDDGGPDRGAVWILDFADGKGGGFPSFCACDGSGTAAPCGNAGAAGHGCGNSAHSGGGVLTATGDAIVGADTVVLEAQGLVGGQFMIFFQGDAAINGGHGVAFGDGLRCVGGNVWRYYPPLLVGSAGSVNSSGHSLSGEPAGPTTVHAGDTRHYQGWYRDPGGPCSQTFNLTNALSITWQ